MTADTKLLVADADSSVRSIVRLSAQEEGWHCDEAADDIAAIKHLRKKEYHLAVLDADLPSMGGLIVCMHVKKHIRTPIILLSRSGQEEDRLAGFAAGCNDFVIKPFYPRELMARAKNLLKLCGVFQSAEKFFTAGQMQIHAHSRTAYLCDCQMQLTPKEYDLLLFFVKNPHQAFSRDMLLDRVWGIDFIGTDRTVDTHVKSLRAKLHPYPHYIETVWGIGYKFSPVK